MTYLLYDHRKVFYILPASIFFTEMNVVKCSGLVELLGNLSLYYFFDFYVHLCVGECMSVHQACAKAYEGQKKVSDPVELEL